MQGHFDGFTAGRLHGWAWAPERPDEPLRILITVNGALFAELEASQFRPDLRAAGIGHGRYGFNIPFDADVASQEPLRVVARVKDGPLLTDGELSIGGPPPAEDREVPAFKAFVAAVLGRKPEDGAQATAPPVTTPPVHFIVHSAVGQEPAPGSLGLAEYSYGFVLRAFAPLLEQIGSVHVVSDPLLEVDALHLEHLERGETSLFLSFAPPHRTVLGLRCPTVPVIAWEFPTIPSAVWDEDRRHDWRWVLRQTGRAITLSGLAARAIKAGLGPDFPVVSIPAPVWDRQAGPSPARPVDHAARLSLEGYVYDTQGRRFGTETAYSPPPPAIALADTAEIDGVVFTSVLAPKDGRKNWMDIVSAFLAGLGGAADATLVLKMVGADPGYWWWELQDILSRAPPFVCRVVILQGFLGEQAFGELVSATHWVVNASKAEGLCLPLLEFMCAGRPAVAPNHTAMADYIDARGALVVQSDEEHCGWPQDPRNEMVTTRHRVSWSSLRDRFAEAYAISKDDSDRYGALSRGAAEVMKAFCSDEAVAARLDSFLGLGRREPAGPAASDLILTYPAI